MKKLLTGFIFGLVALLLIAAMPTTLNINQFGSGGVLFIKPESLQTNNQFYGVSKFDGDINFNTSGTSNSISFHNQGGGEGAGIGMRPGGTARWYFVSDGNFGFKPTVNGAYPIGSTALKASRIYSYSNIIGESNVVWTSGDGSPEGAISAPPGSIYSRDNGGAGTSAYIKESGVGNTGWIAITSGGGGFSGNSDQFASGGGETYIKISAIVTNISATSATDGGVALTFRAGGVGVVSWLQDDDGGFILRDNNGGSYNLATYSHGSGGVVFGGPIGATRVSATADIDFGATLTDGSGNFDYDGLDLAIGGKVSAPTLQTSNYGGANETKLTSSSLSLTADGSAKVTLSDDTGGNLVIGAGKITVTGQTTAGIVTNNTSGDYGTMTALPASFLPASVTNASVDRISVTLVGNGSAITAGTQGFVEIPFACTITRVTMLADATGSAVVDFWKTNYANFPPTVSQGICASAKPTITSATKSQDSTLTGWTTSIAAGDILKWNVDSCSTITNLVIVLRVLK